MEQTAALSGPSERFAAGSLEPILQQLEQPEAYDAVEMEGGRCASAGSLSPMLAAKTVQRIEAVVGDG